MFTPEFERRIAAKSGEPPTVLPSELTDEGLELLVAGDESVEGLTLAREDTGPGKFEGAANPGLAARLHEKSVEGWTDEEAGSTDDGLWSGRVGRFVLHEDAQGFVTYDEHATEAEAREAFEGAA